MYKKSRSLRDSEALYFPNAQIFIAFIVTYIMWQVVAFHLANPETHLFLLVYIIVQLVETLPEIAERGIARSQQLTAKIDPLLV